MLDKGGAYMIYSRDKVGAKRVDLEYIYLYLKI